MNDLISPKYQMRLISDIENTLWDLFPTSKYRNVRFYIEKWHEKNEGYNLNDYWENFVIYETNDKNIDLTKTLHNIDGATLLKIAIDLGVDTPDFIPSIPMFKNKIKSDYVTAYGTFDKAFKQIETHPDMAVGLANSALESIIKEILKDERISGQIKVNKKTLYDLTIEIVKIFRISSSSEMPVEIKTMVNSLLTINQSIEKLRSEKTNVHGKTDDDYVINDSLYTYFVFNCVATVGLFLYSYYKTKFPKVENSTDAAVNDIDDLPF